MATETKLNELKINYLTEAQYEAAKTNNQINDNELYMTSDTNEKDLKRKVATAYLDNGAPDIKNAKIPLSGIITNSDKLTLSNNGIKIGAGISKILVSGNVFLQSSSTTSYLWTSIRKNTTEISLAIDNYNTYFASTSHSPKLVDVQEGDIIYLWKIDDSGGTLRGANKNTYLTVEVVE